MVLMAWNPFFLLLSSHPELTTVFPGTSPLEWFPGPCRNSCFFLCYSGLKFCVNWKNTGKQDRQGRCPSLCGVDAEGLQSGCQLRIPAVTWNKARSLPQPPHWQDEDLSHVHSFLPSLELRDIRENKLCPQGVYILVQEDKQ